MNDPLPSHPLTPIGIYRTDVRFPQQAPRQATEPGAVSGRIELYAGHNFETALRDLAGFERIWLITLFHKAHGWRPTARPPIPPAQGDRVGLFASRSPYRPNPIGLSCVRLQAIHGRIIEVEEADLLDETPILDIKPYIPAFDSFADAKTGWLEDQPRQEWRVVEDESFTTSATRLVTCGGPDVAAACRSQLTFNPFDASRKRVEWSDSPDDGSTKITGVFRFRTWYVGVKEVGTVANYIVTHIPRKARLSLPGCVSHDMARCLRLPCGSERGAISDARKALAYRCVRQRGVATSTAARFLKVTSGAIS